MNRKGFTLIELLVVIAIISVLAAFLMANFVGIRERARDAQRKSDLRQIQSALEMYRSDVGSYPLSLYDVACDHTPPPTLTKPLDSSVVYMRKIPCDPLNKTTQYDYNSTDGATYEIIACIENDGDPEKDSASRCSGQQSFTVNNP